MRINFGKRVLPVFLALPLIFSGGGAAGAATAAGTETTDTETVPAYAESVTVSSETDTVTVGDVISEGGIYRVSETASDGVITVATTDAVTLVGSGLTVYNHPCLSIDCICEGVSLTIEDLRIDSPDDDDTYGISFTGPDNTLTVEGENLIQTCSAYSDETALIRVPEDTELTINGSGILCMYLKTDGPAAAIGADEGCACGTIIFDGASVLISTSKYGIPVGGDLSGTVIVRSGELSLASSGVAVYPLISAESFTMEGGAVLLVNGGKGDYDLTAPTITVTGGSLLCSSDRIKGTISGAKYSAVGYCEIDVSGEDAFVDTTSSATSYSGGSDSSESWEVLVDGEVFYSGNGHVHDAVGNARTNDAFGLFLTRQDHTIEINGAAFSAVWDADSKSFSVSADADSEDAEESEDAEGSKDAEESGDTGDSEDAEDSGEEEEQGDTDTLVLRRGNVFYFQESAETAVVVNCVSYGRSADEILIGDWDGDGTDTICARRGNVYYFTNDATFTSAEADAVLVYGKSTDEVLAGDWDGDGVDTLCVRRGNVYYFTNDATLTSAEADTVLAYGKSTDKVLAGCWEGNAMGEQSRVDTLAVCRGSICCIGNDLISAEAAVVLDFGEEPDGLLAGDWNGDGYDTLCVKNGNVYTFRFELSDGEADAVTVFGRATDETYAGRWGF